MSEIQNQTGSINDILKMMSRASESFAFEIYIPSLKRAVMFRQMTTGQQKRLLKAIIDNPAYQTEFIFAFKQIITENCIETLSVDNLTIYDKLIIAITLRSMSIGNDLELEFAIPTKKNEEAQKIVRKINLKDLVDKALAEIRISPTTITDDLGIFEVFCDLPTISDEYRLEMEMRKNANVEIKNESELRDTVGEVFSSMLVKYIKEVKIKEGDQLFTFDLKPLPFKDRLAIMSKLPTKVSNQIVNYINTVSKEFDKLTLFKETINGTEVEQRMKIDSSFFTPS
jgi:hypothetical protein